MVHTTDLIIVGSGPAGMAAATTAAMLGLYTVMVDEHAEPGGQIYRRAGDSPLDDPGILGPDYQRGADLIKDLTSAPVTRISGSTVWQVSREREVGIANGDGVQLLSGKRIILATGAVERPVPIPGWTLPGVMTAGGGQLLLKSAGVVPDTPVVIAGSGPLLFLVAWQYLKVGVEIAAVVETTSFASYRAAIPHLPRALGAWRYLAKGIRYIADLRRAGIRLVQRATDLAVEGVERAEALTCMSGGRRLSFESGIVLLHQGVVPNVQITRSLGCTHDWDEDQLCWRPRVDEWGNTEIDGIGVAGDGAGILGAVAAEQQGQLSALEAACALGQIRSEERDKKAQTLVRKLAYEKRIRPFLDTLYQPPGAIRRPPDDVIVCRCEEVTAGDIRRMVELGCLGPNQTKSFGRCGMGPCQGRLCGLTVSEIIAAERGVPVADVGYYRIRPPIKPILLGDLAALAGDTSEGG